MEDVDPFDLRRMFIGDFSLLLTAEIAVRTIVMYLFALLVVRLLGKRGMESVSPFEYVIVFAIGAAVGDPMLYPEVPLVHGMMVLTLIVALQRTLEAASTRSRALNNVFASTPTLLIRSGEVLHEAAKRERVSIDELLMRLREAGVTNVAQVQLAYLESSGVLSVIREETVSRPGRSTLDIPGEDGK